MAYLFVLAAVLSVSLTGPLFFLVRYLKARQVEREEGPVTHKGKAGTPTLGGIGLVLAIIILALIFVDLRYVPVILLTAGFALIGLADDLFKIIRKQNLGLTFWQKIFLQTVFAGFFCFYVVHFNIFSLFGIWSLIFGIFIVVGSANATNLTDGLDGLLAGCATLAFLAFGVVSLKQMALGGAAFSFISAGAVFAFLRFNFPKAQLFMGDVGSLSIGAALAGLAVLNGWEWSLALIGGVFVIEALSVIIQVTSYKLFRKRIFKMSPLHHHFELLGFPETTVVLGFWAFQLILSVVGAILG
jgi:phospho-N-acetylmuramoyl-pentapeptide-transferase